MGKRTINIIILLMSIALFGISVIQFYWLKKGIDLNARNFNDRVHLALSRVKLQIEDSASNIKNLTEGLSQDKASIFKRFEGKDPVINYRDRIRQEQLESMSWYRKPELALNSIVLADLIRSLRVELQNQDIALNYDYGIFNHKEESFYIMNGSYLVSIGESKEKSEGATVKNLEKNAYEVSLFSIDEKKAAGSLRVFFPKRNSFLIRSILPALLSSVILTGLILFCFVYTINVILTQKKVSQMKTDFINNMTHEFKTPIATISLAADSINNPMVKNKPTMIERYSKIIKEENNRMLDQVEKVLQIARLDKKDIQLKIIPLNINDLVSSAVEMASLKIRDKGGNISKTLNANSPMIQGDENHISNLLHNLLDNANKYSPEAPDISVETRSVDGGVQVLISDKGIGMSKEDMRRIFEKFYRVSTGNLHDVKGFGLGLSYVKAIVDAHRGNVKVTSEINKGSTFTVFLPSVVPN